MADNSLITQEQYNADMKRFYNDYIYQYLNGSTHTGCVPLGTILPYFGETAPTHFLICDGTTYNKVDYPELSAHLLALTDPSPYVVSGDDTKFKVPDLRGEFLRGSGTNGHTNQGDGANVGVHQDGTNIFYQKGSNTSYMPGVFYPTGTEFSKFTNSVDNLRDSTSTAKGISNATGKVDYNADVPVNAGTSRPTNTSVTYIIAYRNAYIDLALDGFPIDITNPTDGQLLMWDATAGRWVNGGHKYSTDEHVVGTWIDGKPLYEKTFYIPSPIGDQELLRDVAFCYTIAKTYNRIETGSDCDDFWNNSSNYTNIRGFLNSSTHKVVLAICKPSNYTLTDVYITLQYTKTTDTV